ncbi:MAG: ChbG/HpnK family deacetylase [Clostridia bacterium]|nr:ChbG/HpnK family deacetylase [Clostridia bacterium]MBQ4338230.1 ChbG/HpnK family deacetylase [Clostridia bacterium]
MKKLIITADDYGMCADVNKAIEECVQAGIVLSTNVMTNMSCCEDAAYLKDKYPVLSVGLHYNFTVGTPLSPADKVSSLIDKDGRFLSYNSVREACKNKRYDFEQVKTEMIAQYKRYIEICGEPSYWNTHQNVHVYPDVYPLFRDVSFELGIKKMRSHQRIFVPSSTGKSDKSLKWTLTNPIKCRMLDNWQEGSKKMGISAPDGIIVRMNETDKLNLEYLFGNIKWKNNLIAEMIIHPSLTSDCEYFGGITEGRVKEYEIFSKSIVKKIADKNNIEIMNFEL